MGYGKFGSKFRHPKDLLISECPKKCRNVSVPFKSDSYLHLSTAVSKQEIERQGSPRLSLLEKWKKGDDTDEAGLALIRSSCEKHRNRGEYAIGCSRGCESLSLSSFTDKTQPDCIILVS